MCGAASNCAGGEGSQAILGTRSSGGFSLSIKNSGLCSVLIMETGPIVYFITIYIKRKGE